MQGESFSHALLQFNNNKFGVLHCHVNDIPMEEIPFFQIFGSKVSQWTLVILPVMDTTVDRESLIVKKSSNIDWMMYENKHTKTITC